MDRPAQGELGRKSGFHADGTTCARDHDPVEARYANLDDTVLVEQLGKRTELAELGAGASNHALPRKTAGVGLHRLPGLPQQPFHALFERRVARAIEITRTEPLRDARDQ